MIKNNFFLPVLYLISIISDLLSTFFASPNLEGERAFDAQIFDLKWVGLISFSALYFLCFTTFFIYSRNKLSDKTMISNSYYYFFLVGIIMIIQLTFSGFLASFNNFTIYLLETKKLSGMLYSFLFSYTNLNFNLIQSVGFSVNDIIRLCFFIILYFNIKKIFPFKRV
jgi:hypothetical protein